MANFFWFWIAHKYGQFWIGKQTWEWPNIEWISFFSQTQSLQGSSGNFEGIFYQMGLWFSEDFTWTNIKEHPPSCLPEKVRKGNNGVEYWGVQRNSKTAPHIVPWSIRTKLIFAENSWGGLKNAALSREETFIFLDYLLQFSRNFLFPEYCGHK